MLLRKWFIKEIFRLSVFWCIGIVLNLHGDCLAYSSVNHKRTTILSKLKTLSSLYDDKGRRENETEQRIASPQSNGHTGGNGFTRNLNATKLKTVCRLLEKALDGLKEFSQSAPEGGISKLKDKSPKPKPKPSLCCIPCGCGGCCLMRPMTMLKVKYTPPKFKMKPLKSKTKCGSPHYGIYLGRKRR